MKKTGNRKNTVVRKPAAQWVLTIHGKVLFDQKKNESVVEARKALLGELNNSIFLPADKRGVRITAIKAAA